MYLWTTLDILLFLSDKYPWAKEPSLGMLEPTAAEGKPLV